MFTGIVTDISTIDRVEAREELLAERMLRRGMRTALVRDLTDAMYNPERPPYVSHAEGTRLIVEYIEKMVCPTMDSGQL